MSEYAVQVDRLVATAERMDRGSVQVSALQEAVRLADRAQDPVRAFEARMKLVDAAKFSGDPEIALIAFTWCLAEADWRNSLDPPWSR